METLELEILTIHESLSVTGGAWFYDPKADEWYWVEPRGLDDPFVIRDISRGINIK